jgi:hypothetical protein
MVNAINLTTALEGLTAHWSPKFVVCGEISLKSASVGAGLGQYCPRLTGDPAISLVLRFWRFCLVEGDAGWKRKIRCFPCKK